MAKQKFNCSMDFNRGDSMTCQEMHPVIQSYQERIKAAKTNKYMLADDVLNKKNIVDTQTGKIYSLADIDKIINN